MAAAPVVRVRDVTKSYGVGSAKTQVLRGVNLDVEAGELPAQARDYPRAKSPVIAPRCTRAI